MFQTTIWIPGILFAPELLFPVSFFFKLFISLFLAGLSLHCLMQAFSSCCTQGLLSSCGTLASHGSDLSCCRAQALGPSGFSSCGTWAQQLQPGL